MQCTNPKCLWLISAVKSLWHW